MIISLALMGSFGELRFFNIDVFCHSFLPHFPAVKKGVSLLNIGINQL